MGWDLKGYRGSNCPIIQAGRIWVISSTVFSRKASEATISGNWKLFWARNGKHWHTRQLLVSLIHSTGNLFHDIAPSSFSKHMSVFPSPKVTGSLPSYLLILTFPPITVFFFFFFWYQDPEKNWNLLPDIVSLGVLGTPFQLLHWCGLLGAVQHINWVPGSFLILQNSTLFFMFSSYSEIKVASHRALRSSVSYGTHFLKHPLVTKKSRDSYFRVQFLVLLYATE